MGKELPFRLILASGSRGRRELLERAAYQFEVIPSNIEEPDPANYTDIRRFVHETAWRKAQAVAARIDAGLVLAADSVGWIHDQVIGKPADEADARRILRTLAGTTHELWTAVVLWRRPDDLQIAFQEATRVAFKSLTDPEIDAYLATRLWQGCSGAYAIQPENDPYLTVEKGSWSNVVGLPMERLEQVLGWVAKVSQ